MSFPQNPNLPKPPPKLPPAGRPGAATPVVPAPGAPTLPQRPTASAAPSSIGPARPNLAHSPATQPQPQMQPTARAATPMVDLRGLPANVAPMVEAIRLYDDLLTEENALLRAGDANGVSALLDRKMAATRLYQERLRTLLGDGQATRSMNPDQRGSVIGMVRGLEERVKENAILLKANMSAIEQLFEVINTAARKMRRQEVAYSKGGQLWETYSRQGASLAYNSTI